MNSTLEIIIYGSIGLMVGLKIVKAFTRISFEKAKELIANGAKVIDVREPVEYKSRHIKNAINIPLASIDSIGKKISKKEKIIVYCQSGARSNAAYKKLKSMGYDVYDFGGIGRWKEEKNLC